MFKKYIYTGQFTAKHGPSYNAAIHINIQSNIVCYYKESDHLMNKKMDLTLCILYVSLESLEF